MPKTVFITSPLMTTHQASAHLLREGCVADLFLSSLLDHKIVFIQTGSNIFAHMQGGELSSIG